MNMTTPFGLPLSDQIVNVPNLNPEIQEDQLIDGINAKIWEDQIIDGINPEIWEEGNNHPDDSEKPEIQDDSKELSLASCREHWTICMPARYVTNHVGLLNIGEGEENPIMLLLRDEIDELQIKLDKCDADIPDIQQALIDVEIAYLTKPNSLSIGQNGWWLCTKS